MAQPYATPAEVLAVFSGRIPPNMTEDKIQAHLEIFSSRLSVWKPGLREFFDSLADDSDQKQFIKGVIVEAVRRVISNPEGISSETMGPYAYSKFDSEDPNRRFFDKYDLDAIDMMLMADRNKQRGSFTMKPALAPVAPITASGRYTNASRRRRRRGNFYVF